MFEIMDSSPDHKVYVWPWNESAKQKQRLEQLMQTVTDRHTNAQYDGQKDKKTVGRSGQSELSWV